LGRVGVDIGVGELYQVINRWAEANRIEQFIKDLDVKARGLPETERIVVFDRIRLAREMIESTDALDHLMQWKSPQERIALDT
jgi:hypothetical protein